MIPDTESSVPRTTSEAIDRLVRRIVEDVHPLRILLFGSATRGELAAGSDIDLLVVMPDGTHRRRTAQTCTGDCTASGHRSIWWSQRPAISIGIRTTSA